MEGEYPVDIRTYLTTLCPFRCLFIAMLVEESVYCIPHVLLPSLSLCPCFSASVTGSITAKFDIVNFSENLSTEFKFCYNRTNVYDTLNEDPRNFYFCRRYYIGIKSLCDSEMVWPSRYKNIGTRHFVTSYLHYFFLFFT
jgi:hypothetical protein